MLLRLKKGMLRISIVCIWTFRNPVYFCFIKHYRRVLTKIKNGCCVAVCEKQMLETQLAYVILLCFYMYCAGEMPISHLKNRENEKISRNPALSEISVTENEILRSIFLATDRRNWIAYSCGDIP